MGIAFQLYSVEQPLLERLVAANSVDDFITEGYCRDLVGDGFEAKWLDKSGMGILEAFGAFDGALAAPGEWMLGSNEPLPSAIGITPPMLVMQSRVRDVAEWIQNVSDEEFAERVSKNELDSDTEYLAHWFGELRDFYCRTAESGRAVIVYCSG